MLAFMWMPLDRNICPKYPLKTKHLVAIARPNGIGPPSRTMCVFTPQKELEEIVDLTSKFPR